MSPETDASRSSRVEELHRRALVIDALSGDGTAYEAILAGGVSAVTVTLNMYGAEGFEHVLNQARRYLGLVEAMPDRVMLVEEAGDIARAKESGRLGLILGMQNGAPLEGDVTRLPILHKLGVRVLQLTYNEANALGCGCLEPHDTGLTALGGVAVGVMNRLGILVDLSHVGLRTSREAAETSRAPVAITHGNPLALKDVARNKPDDLLRLVAEGGGVIGLTPYAAFCKSAPGKRPTLADFLDQVDYMVDLVGVDHVGIGTDMFEGRPKVDYLVEVQTRYSGLIPVPFEERHIVELPSTRYFPRLTGGLVARGYSDEECLKILGGNFLGLYERVWKNPYG